MEPGATVDCVEQDSSLEIVNRVLNIAVFRFGLSEEKYLEKVENLMNFLPCGEMITGVSLFDLDMMTSLLHPRLWRILSGVVYCLCWTGLQAGDTGAVATWNMLSLWVTGLPMIYDLYTSEVSPPWQALEGL